MSLTGRGLSFVLAAAFMATAGPLSVAQDWPQWRGPNRDGVVADFDEPAEWPERLRQRWSAGIGLGYATPILIGDRLYVFTRQGDDEVMMALEASTGSIIWRTSYAAPFSMSPAADPHGDGPKSTPAFDDGRLYTLGMGGVVTAFDAEAGERLWQTPPSEVGPLYGTSMSPLVDGDRVIVHVGGHDDGALTAFDSDTGEVVWQWDGDGPAYGSPIAAEFGGVRQIVTFTQERLVGVDAATGELLWERPYTTSSTQNTITPIVYRNTLIISGLRNGIVRFRVARMGADWVTGDLWTNREVSLYMANAVLAGDVLFGMSSLNSGQYFALDAETGRTIWTSEPRRGRNAAIVRAGDVFFVLEEDGELLIVGAGSEGFEPIRRYPVGESATWTQPVVAGDRVFVKDVETLFLYTLN